VDQPDFGVLLADMAVPDSAEVALAGLLQPRVEAEVAFVLKADLPQPQPTTVDVIRAVDHLLPAIEIVDSRVVDWNISIVDTVADNASSGKFVLGTAPRRLVDVDLRLCGMVLEHRFRSGPGRPAWATRCTRSPGWPARWPAPASRYAPATWCSPARSARWCR
jgi:2-keto-4-pentenoate hydratase